MLGGALASEQATNRFEKEILLVCDAMRPPGRAGDIIRSTIANDYHT